MVIALLAFVLQLCVGSDTWPILTQIVKDVSNCLRQVAVLHQYVVFLIIQRNVAFPALPI